MAHYSFKYSLGVWIALIVIFSVSIVVRLNLINNTVTNYDHCNFFLDPIFQNWQQRGMADCHFSPVLTYTNSGDKHMVSYKRLESPEGDNYFVSFPPFAFMLTYKIFSLLHITSGKLSIQIANLLLHFISSIFIYLLVFNYCNRNSTVKSFIPAVTAFAVYVFTPIVMYTHVMIYFPETLGQVLWIVALYLSVKWFNSYPTRNHTVAYLLFVVLFFLIYTEWIGIFYVATLFFLVGSNESIGRADKLFIRKGVIISSLVALTLMLIQYLSINGIVALVRAFALRYVERSGWFDAAHSDRGVNYFTAESYFRFAHNIHAAFFPFGYILLVLIAFIIILYKPSYVWQAVLKNKIILGLSFFPGLIHLLVFFNSSVVHKHCVSVLAPAIAVSLGILVKFIDTQIFKNKVTIRFSVVVLLCLSVALASLYFKKSILYYPDYSYLTQLANFIKNDAQSDESVFININTNLDSPLNYISFKSKRSILEAKDTTEVKYKLQERHKTKAVFYFFTSKSTVPFIYRYTNHSY